MVSKPGHRNYYQNEYLEEKNRRLEIMKKNGRIYNYELNLLKREFIEDRNLRLISVPAGEIYETVYREEIAPLDPMTNWDKIKQYNDSFYEITP